MKNGRHHAWLFAFVDLAFLTLISISLVPAGQDNQIIGLLKADLPVVPENPDTAVIRPSDTVWKLRIYAQSDTHPTPFKLEKDETGDAQNEPKNPNSKYITRDELVSELTRLKSEIGKSPLLLPEKTSFSNDLLFAAAAVARIWSEGNNLSSAVKIEKSNDGEAR